MIDRLIKGGSLLWKAQQIFSSRSVVLNKIYREHKNLQANLLNGLKRAKKVRTRRALQEKETK
jgi:hypothetical protein